MPAEKDLRDWRERNQGPMPQADPMSRHTTSARDIAKPGESDGPNGDVEGEPGAGGATGDGTHGGTGSIGGTGSPNATTQSRSFTSAAVFEPAPDVLP